MRNARLQHPAVGAALAARNAVATEMAMAGRAGLTPGELTWELATDAFEDRHGERTVGSSGAHALPRVHELSVPLPHLATHLARERDLIHARSIAATWLRKPTARRRREFLEMAFWFGVGGLGGLVALAAVRMVEALLSPR